MFQILAWAHGRDGGMAAFLVLVAVVLLVAAALGNMSRNEGYDRD
jgi:hypothetical protein